MISAVIATGGDPRIAGYQAARSRVGAEPAQVIDYRVLLSDMDAAVRQVSGAQAIRVESPGRDIDVLSGLMRWGIQRCVRESVHHLRLDQIPGHVSDRGRLLPARQIFYGLIGLLEALLVRQPQLRLIPDIATLEATFDKRRCHRLLSAHDVPVPRAMTGTGSFDALMADMHTNGLQRVFVKLQHGSAAAGTVALAVSRYGMRAVSTVDMASAEQGTRLYNTRRVRTYTDPAEIALLIDALAPHGLHVEAWVPKAMLGADITDLRVLVVQGEPRLRVLRRSRFPMTNLHLGGIRDDAETLLARLPRGGRAALDEVCRRVAGLFPGALQLGLDIAVTAGLRSHVVLEVNAFGDLLKGVTDAGRDAYDLQVMEPVR